MKVKIPFYLSGLAGGILLCYVVHCAQTNTPSTNPPTVLQSAAAKTNTPPVETEEQRKQREFMLAFQQGAMYGAFVLSRNADATNDLSFLVRTAYAIYLRDQQKAGR